MLKIGTFTLILGAVGLALMAALVVGGWERFPLSMYEPSVEQRRPGQENSIRRAVYANDRLWLLSNAGELWTVRQTHSGATRIELPKPAFDLCVQNDAPVIVTGERGTAAAWRLLGWKDAEWTTIGAVASQGDGLVAVQCAADRLILVTTRRIIELQGGQETALELSHRIPAQMPNVILTTPTHVFVGLNAGEWGGGLQRIDRRTGEVAVPQRNVSGDLCGGPLNPDCDPVAGLAPAVEKSGCVVAAVGLRHMGAHGRIVEICGDRVERLYTGPCPDDLPKEQLMRTGTDGERLCTEPFSGVMQKGRALVAVSAGGLSTISEPGVAVRAPLPMFADYGPFAVSFNSPGVVLVNGTANQRRSFGGEAPLLVVR